MSVATSVPIGKGSSMGIGEKRERGSTASIGSSVAAAAVEIQQNKTADRSMEGVGGRAMRGPRPWEMSLVLALVFVLFGRAGSATVSVFALLRTSGVSKVRSLLGYTKAAAVLAFLGSILVLPTVGAGKCTFTQECFQSGVDTDCTPVPVEGDAAQSFPMDASHGFGVAHEKVWDGSVEDPSTGLCQEGTPDADGRCMVDFVTPKGLQAVAPIICPQYAGDGCCSWQQNYALYQNLGTLVDSFGSTTGCLACAVNLVNFWCALICAPHQGTFATIHDPPFAQRSDDLTGRSGRVLQADVTVDADLACKIYESCKSVAIVGETTAMQSGLGLLKFQMQTGAVGHGEFFFLSFANLGAKPCAEYGRLPPPLPSRLNVNRTAVDAQAASAPASKPSSVSALASAPVSAAASDSEGDAQATPALPPSSLSSVSSYLSLDTFACESFYDPGSTTIPFAYPPKEEDLISCTCDYCSAACSGGGSTDVDVTDKNPIPVLDGFGFGLVGGVYAAVVVCSLTLFWWRRSQHKRYKRAAAIWTWIHQH
ncbi:unnamed protein product [Pylaiella littoralis]